MYFFVDCKFKPEFFNRNDSFRVIQCVNTGVEKQKKDIS